MRIAFVTEGGLELGMGHVQHSITLAGELLHRAEICFLTKSDDIVAKQIMACGFETYRLNNDNEVANSLREMAPNVVIIDNLNVDERLAESVKSGTGAKLVIFNNVETAANRHADIAVCADFGSNFKNLRFRDTTTGTLYFYGPKYWILRKEFLEFHKKAKVAPKRVKKILLIFGGSDPSNLTSMVLDELLTLRASYKISVILGAHFGHLDAFDGVLSKHQDDRERVNVYRDARNVAELMYRADLVIASPGLSAFEALCVWTPVVIVPQNSFQRDVYQAYMVVLEMDKIPRLGQVLATADFVDPHDERISSLEIGQGMSELIDAIIDNE